MLRLDETLLLFGGAYYGEGRFYKNLLDGGLAMEEKYKFTKITRSSGQ